MAFRRWFARINEIQSIANRVPVVALTVMATTVTRLQIVKALEMKKPALIVDIPNRASIASGIKDITPKPAATFSMIVIDLKAQKTRYERTIIYCPTIKLTTHLYGFFQADRCSSNISTKQNLNTFDDILPLNCYPENSKEQTKRQRNLQ